MLSKQAAVLVVEDDSALRWAYVQQLESFGVSAEAASTYDEALGRIGNGHYSMILLDLEIAVGDGLNLVRDIRSLEKKQGGTISFIVGLADRARRDVCLQAGMNEHMELPLLGYHLKAFLERAGIANHKNTAAH